MPQHLGWYQVAEEGGGQAGHWVKHSCGKHQAAPCGAQADAAPCFLQEQQAPGTSLREAAAQAGLQGAPWEKLSDSVNEALLDFLDSGLAVIEEELQSSQRKAESF